MRSIMTSTIRANSTTRLIFAAVLLLGLTPLWAGGVTGKSGSGTGTGSGSGGTSSTSGQTAKVPSSPSAGGGEGIVNVPRHLLANLGEPSPITAETCRVNVELDAPRELVLRLEGQYTRVIATITHAHAVVSNTLHEGELRFDRASLEALREVGVHKVDILLSVSEHFGVRIRIELPAHTEIVRVLIK